MPVLFILTDKPTISTPVSTVRVNESDPLRLRCSADGNPKPVVSWRKSSSGDETKKGPVYNKSKVSKGDTGTYTCTATNSLGDASASITVTVQCKC